MKTRLILALIFFCAFSPSADAGPFFSPALTASSPPADDSSATIHMSAYIENFADIAADGSISGMPPLQVEQTANEMIILY